MGYIIKQDEVFMMQIYSISYACDHFEELRLEALKGKEIFVEDDEQNGSPLISIIPTELLDSLTEIFIFVPHWEEDNSIYTVSTNVIDVIGYGNTRDEAAEVLAIAAMEYARLYFLQIDYYRSPLVNRGLHYPYLRRIARCNDNIALVKHVLGV